MDDDRWDERYEPTGWGEHAHSGLLDAVTEGLDAFLTFAATDAGVFEPTASAIADLLLTSADTTAASRSAPTGAMWC